MTKDVTTGKEFFLNFHELFQEYYYEDACSHIENLENGIN